ncbi:hypothetical protein [Aureivirga sp. CE67]|uniref:hypothetical protein n=1 Tax=Aureivirga sp. CE67 TaxID=1788983 RepID=UPI0018C908D6|nr:hypothetical protein [Aureivirga sp. CE67]
MKKLIILILILTTQYSYSQELSDSTVINMAKFNCQCQDTINLNQENTIIESQLRDCFTKSLVTFLNKGELTQDYLNNNEKLNDLQRKVFNHLATCERTVQIVQKLNDLPVPIDSVPTTLFISKKFFNKHGLKQEQVEKDFIVWNSDSNEHIQRIVDIRWVFNSNEEAIKYHKGKLKENSENGQKVEFNMNLDNVEELHVFKESKQMENMIQMMNLPQKQHCFLFVVDNIAFKVFVATDKSKSPEDIVFIVNEAVNQMKIYNR